MRDGYEALKNLIVKRFRSKPDIENALQKVEERPESQSWQGVLMEELDAAGADKDAELVEEAKKFLTMMKEKGLLGATTYNAIQTGNGGLAQGTGAMAAGAGGLAIGGNVSGDVIMGVDRKRREKEGPSDSEGDD